jgi:hypothetical protein
MNYKIFLKNFNLKLKNNEKLCLISEEYGFQDYLWIHKFSNKKLINYWKQLESITWQDIKNLPGNVILISSTKIDNDVNNKNFEVFNKLKTIKSLNYCHIFDNETSFLRVENMFLRTKNHYFDTQKYLDIN